MIHNATAENVLATIGTVLWCIQLVPQIIHNYKVKECTGLPPAMMFIWALSGVPFSIYFYGIDGSIPLRIQPVLFTLFCTISWTQTLFYPPVSMSVRKMSILVATFCIVSAGAMVGFILWLRPLYRRGIEWPMLVFGIIASVLLAVGLVPPYFELAKRRGRVVGINFVFLTMDSMGALFSLLSIVVGEMDIMSMILYAIVLAMEIGIFMSNYIWYITGGKEVIRQEKLEAASGSKMGEESSCCSLESALVRTKEG